VVESTRDDTNLFSYEETKSKIDFTQPDVIINAAAKVGGILANNTYRTEFIIENLKINLNILEACLGNSEIKVINLGSSCIYPLHAENPINEDSFMKGELEPTNSPYAMAKITAIEMGRSMNTQYGHNIINLMPTNLYGPNDNFSENDSHVIPGLIHKMHKAKINDENIFKIWGSGTPLREFLFVDDLSSAVEFIIKNDISIDLLNVGSGDEISILDLANEIKNVIGFKGKIELDKSKPDGNPRKLLDSSKLNKLGWHSETTLVEGLTKTYNWYKQNFN
jgi:GDP-L-fucose synthase